MAKFDLKKILTKENLETVKTTLVDGVNTGVDKVVPKQSDNPERWFLKLLVIGLVLAMFFAGIVGLAGFSLTLQKSEEVVVPSLTGKEYIDAIMELQALSLIPFVQERFYNNPESRGRIMEQEPAEGTIIKSGRKVTLLLSKGAVLNKVGDYIGKNIEEIRENLRAAFGQENALVELGTVNYIFDNTEPGTILSQEPAPGTELTKAVKVAVLVSKGKDETLAVVPLLVGTSYTQAMEKLASLNVPFRWTLVEGHSDYQSASVLEQVPVAETTLAHGQQVELSLTPMLKIPAGNSFGIYRKILPEYAVPVDISVQIHDEQGDVRTIYQFKSLGGELSFPYLAPERSSIVILGFGKTLDTLFIESSGTP